MQAQQACNLTKGRILIVDTPIAEHSHDVLGVLDAPPLLHPLPTVLTLQKLAHTVALVRGHNVDRPRNLAKSVFVE